MAFLFVKRMIEHRKNEQDFSKYFGDVPQTRKQRLIEKCQRNDVSIYIDSSSEQSNGVYAALREVVSEAELERRLNAKKSVSQSSRANLIAAIALIISLVALVKSFL